MKLSEALKAFKLALIGEVAENTQEWYDYKLKPLVEKLGDYRLEEITINHLRGWRADLISKKPAIWTLHGHIRATKHLFKWTVEEGYLTENPAARLRTPPLPDEPPKAISEADLKNMIQTARARAATAEWGERDLALLLLLADTGCRISGLIGLSIDDLELEENRALVREKGRGGNGKSRYVYFGESTKTALERWLRVRPQGSNHLFIGRRGRLTKSGVRASLKRIAHEAEINGRHNPHSLRHAFARRLLTNGADLGTVGDLLGHSSIEVTHDFYARWSNQELAERHRKFSLLDS